VDDPNSMQFKSLPQAAREKPRRGLRRSGFTLIEMMTAVGIILLLVAMSIYGFRHLNRSAKDNSTKTALAMLQALTTEMEASTALSTGKQKGLQLLALGPSCSVVPYQDPTIKVIWTTTTSPPPSSVFDAALDATAEAGDVGPDIAASGKGGRYGDAVIATSIVMGRLMTLPAARAAIEKLPDDRFLKDTTGKVFRAPPNSLGVSSATSGGPVLLDGYGNPIIFVPAAGLKNVDRGGSVGTTLDQAADPSTKIPYRGPVRGRDDKPFWASAGADGKFTGPATPVKLIEGDDNLYSFEQ
jgi:prepilin-type N-terminal cleavage/methylation domain-containing protein